MMRTYIFINALSLSGTLEKRLVDVNKYNRKVKWGGRVAQTSSKYLLMLPQTQRNMGPTAD